jgi:hypothetical protein
MLDLDGKRFDMVDGALVWFLILQVFTCILIQAGFNFITKDIKYWIILVPTTCLVSNLGAFRMVYKDEEGLYNILIEKKRLIPCIIFAWYLLMGMIVLSYILNFGEKEILKLVYKMESIFHSLQEAIITINVKGISFVNGHG